MITVVTAATKSYKPIIERLLDTTARFNYPTILYDLDDLGYGDKIEDVFGVKMDLKHTRRIYAWKPAMILNALNRHQHGTIVWIDADAAILKPFDEMNTEDYDIALTAPREGGDLNAGVMFFNRGLEARLFLMRMVKSTPRWGGKLHREGDQNLLQREMGRYYPNYRRNLYRVVDHDGARLKFVPAELYNNQDPQVEDDPKIIHLPGPNKEERWQTFLKKGSFT